MVQTHQFLRRHDDENTPPTARLANAKSRVRGGIQGASRRRRARSAGGPHHPRHGVEHARQKTTATKHQASLINIELPRASGEVQVPESTSVVTMASVSLPRYLSRPIFRAIPKQNITSIAPELADTELQYIRDGLQFLGPLMLRVLSGVKANPASNVLPKDLEVTVNDLSSDMPTHMLAVYSRDVSPATRRRVTLFPIHSIILATHCTNMSILPGSDVARPDLPGSTITLPVLPLCIPAPELFPQLSNFLYTKRVDHLLGSLLPYPVPHPLYRGDPTSEQVIRLLQVFSAKLATSRSAETLLTYMMSVNGLWRNACALGIDDEQLWCALDVAWEVLILALAISTGKRL